MPATTINEAAPALSVANPKTSEKLVNPLNPKGIKP